MNPPQFVYPKGVAQVSDEQAHVLGQILIGFTRGSKVEARLADTTTTDILNFAVARYKLAAQIVAGVLPDDWTDFKSSASGKRYPISAEKHKALVADAQNLVPNLMTLAKGMEEYAYWRLEKISVGAMKEPTPPSNNRKMF